MKKTTIATLFFLSFGIHHALGEDDAWMIDKAVGSSKDSGKVTVSYSRPDGYGEVYQVIFTCDPSKKSIQLKIVEGLQYQAILNDAVAHMTITFDSNPIFAFSGDVGKTETRIATQEFDLSASDSQKLAAQMQSTRQQAVLKDQFFHDPYILKLTGIQAAGQALSDCLK